MEVFRFTLGIEGFDDAYIPRVVGALGVVLLVINHVLGANPPSSAQVTHPHMLLDAFSRPSAESSLNLYSRLWVKSWAQCWRSFLPYCPAWSSG